MLNVPAAFGGSSHAATDGDASPRPRGAVPAVRMLPPGTRLFAEGEAPGALHEILDGAVVLSRTSSDGHRQILDIAGPGRILGLSVDGVTVSDADTLTRTRLRAVEPARSTEAVAAETRTALRRLCDHAVLLGRKSARERVAAGLLELADLFGTRTRGLREVTLVLPMSRGDLADWLGLVIETVSRSLSALQREGVIQIERTDIVHIVDPSALRAAAVIPHAPRRPGRAA